MADKLLSMTDILAVIMIWGLFFLAVVGALVLYMMPKFPAHAPKFPWWCHYYEPGRAYWFRIKGRGLNFQHSCVPPIFSERYGMRKKWGIPFTKWRVRWLSSQKHR